MTMPAGSQSITGTINHSSPSMSTINGTISGGFIATPPPQQLNPMCFLCIRKGSWISGVTVYQGTWLCQPCAQAVPDTLIINELTLS